MDKGIILQITAGRGPAECCWVVSQVLKCLLKEAASMRLDTVVLHREQGIESGTLFSATVQLSGDGAVRFAEDWKGTIQWVGKSQYRKMHRRNNWFVGVNLINFGSESYRLQDKDIRYEATRAGGPGGQHVNKVSTAVRAVHIPSGITVLASDSRSQSANKKNARERLEKLLLMQAMEERKMKIKENWQNHNELLRGSPVRVFTGPDFNEITVKIN